MNHSLPPKTVSIFGIRTVARAARGSCQDRVSLNNVVPATGPSVVRQPHPDHCPRVELKRSRRLLCGSEEQAPVEHCKVARIGAGSAADESFERNRGFESRSKYGAFRRAVRAPQLHALTRRDRGEEA